MDKRKVLYAAQWHKTSVTDNVLLFQLFF